MEVRRGAPCVCSRKKAQELFKCVEIKCGVCCQERLPGKKIIKYVRKSQKQGAPGWRSR